MQKKQIQRYQADIEVQGQKLPVEVIFERRQGARFAMTRRKILLRLPLGLPVTEVHAQLDHLQRWVEGVAAKKNEVLSPYQIKTYEDGQTITVGNRTYQLSLQYEDRASHTARLVGNTIHLNLSERASPAMLEKSVKKLLSKVISRDLYFEFSKRVRSINNRTFKQPIRNIALKYNQSNWGSCSKSGNLNLSTRLLFAPQDVQDYVILHELAHLVEFNHSDRFWQLIAQFMPDYASKELWLKEHGHKCDF